MNLFDMNGDRVSLVEIDDHYVALSMMFLFAISRRASSNPVGKYWQASEGARCMSAVNLKEVMLDIADFLGPTTFD